VYHALDYAHNHVMACGILDFCKFYSVYLQQFQTISCMLEQKGASLCISVIGYKEMTACRFAVLCLFLLL
jgi:hypothetical protein